MIIEPDCVFITPPGADITVNSDKFAVQPSSKLSGWPTTITSLLLSLAQAYRNRAVAIILSGLGNDGSAALRTIKADGGATFAQSNPDFGDMPRHAIETGYVDFVLPPAEIAKGLFRLTSEH